MYVVKHVFNYVRMYTFKYVRINIITTYTFAHDDTSGRVHAAAISIRSFRRKDKGKTVSFIIQEELSL
jgi:hypothetical protein